MSAVLCFFLLSFPLSDKIRMLSLTVVLVILRESEAPKTEIYFPLYRCGLNKIRLKKVFTAVV